MPDDFLTSLAKPLEIAEQPDPDIAAMMQRMREFSLRLKAEKQKQTAKGEDADLDR